MRKLLIAAACFAVVIAASTAFPTGQKPDAAKAPEPKRPKLTLKATPTFGIAPLRVVMTAELEGGSDDFEEYYCPTVIWEWGDGTISESSSDCQPYEAGKSQIKRRYTVEHIYKRSDPSGRTRAYFSLRHRDKEVAAAGINVAIQPGGTDNRQ